MAAAAVQQDQRWLVIVHHHDAGPIFTRVDEARLGAQQIEVN